MMINKSKTALVLLLFHASALFISAERERNLIDDKNTQKLKPIIEPLMAQQVINQNESWSVTCSGLFPVLWEYPKEDSVRLSIQSLPTNDQGQFVSKLTLDRATYSDTGAYICKYKNAVNAQVSILRIIY